MNRTIAVLAAAVMLTSGAVVRGQEKFDPAVKKLMPADQLEIVEKMEALNEQHATLLFRIKDAKQRREENEKLGTEVTQLQQEIVKKLKAEGLKDWVGTCGVVMLGFVVILDRYQPIHLILQLPDTKKSMGEIEKAVSAIKVNDVVRFSTKPDPNYSMPPTVGKTYHMFDQQITLVSMTSVERIAVKSSPPPAKSPTAGRKKP